MKIPVTIIGAGPAGSASALFLRAHGIDCVIIEKDSFPGFHIGESMTGECGASIRALGLEDEMNRRKFPIKTEAAVFGASGIKWTLPVAGRDQDWNLFSRYTWQVRRDEFDMMLRDTAIARGADFIAGQVTKPIIDNDGAVCGLSVKTADGKTFDIESEMVLDCSGQHTYFANLGITGPKFVGNYDKQMLVHPRDRRCGQCRNGHSGRYYKEKNESKTDFLRRELHELNPELKRRIPDRTCSSRSELRPEKAESADQARAQL